MIELDNGESRKPVTSSAILQTLDHHPTPSHRILAELFVGSMVLAQVFAVVENDAC